MWRFDPGVRGVDSAIKRRPPSNTLQRILPALVCGAVVFSCGKRGKDEKSSLARIGKERILVEEFVNRVEFSPLPKGLDINDPEGREAALGLLIDEKLMAIQARKIGLDRDPVFEKKWKSIQNGAVGRELYREEVQKTVVVNEAEILDAFERSMTRLTVRFLVTPDLATAEKWKTLLGQGMPFSDLVRKESQEGEDPESNRISFGWGETEEALENAAYSLASGEISPVVRTTRGYFILCLEDRSKNVSMSDTEQITKKRSVEKIIRKRKEAAASAEFVSGFMRDKNVRLKGRPYSVLINELQKHIRFTGGGRDRSGMKVQGITDGEMGYLRQNIALWLDTVLVTFKGGNWTVGRFLERLWLDEIPIRRESPAGFRKGLQESIGILVRDDLLAGQGMRKHLDRRPAVRKEIGIWKDHFLYVLLKQRWEEEGNLEQNLDLLRKKTPSRIDRGLLQSLELTGIPVLAVYTGFQRQLVVPGWPQLTAER